MNLKPRMMMGRLSNGFQGGYGKIIHLTESAAYCHGKSLCGRSPGKRSAGWSPDDHGLPNCPKCLDKLRKLSGDNRINFSVTFPPDSPAVEMFNLILKTTKE